MKDNTSIHSLAEPHEKSGKIRFIYFKDGKEHYFYSCVNSLTKNRMSAFDGNAPTINDPLSWVRSMFKKIRDKSEIIECIGDF